MVHIRESLAVGWDMFMKRPWYLFGLSLAIVGLFLVTSTSNALFTALSYIAFGGYIGMLLMHYNGKHIVFDDFFSLDRRWIYFAFLSIIKGILIFFGLLLFIVPGIYLAIRWIFAELLVIDKGMRPIEALNESGRLTKGHMWKLFGFSIVTTLVGLLGVLLFVVGVFPASVIISFAFIDVYRKLLAGRDEVVQVSEVSETPVLDT